VAHLAALGDAHAQRADVGVIVGDLEAAEFAVAAASEQSG
jgi:hypothetical protein